MLQHNTVNEGSVDTDGRHVKSVSAERGHIGDRSAAYAAPHSEGEGEFAKTFTDRPV
uniref:Catalase n=1 Tax=Angiostrongylus cantonensis TaxID=6313 RepID=A0A0K0D663_ANGCA